MSEKKKRPKQNSQAPAGKAPSDSQRGQAPAISKTQEPQAVQEQTAGPGDRAERTKPPERLFVFPSVNICPRCRGTYTRVRSTQKNVRYVTCMSAVCRHNFTVLGRRIEP